MNSAWPAFRHDSLHTGRSALSGPNAATLAWSRQLGAGPSTGSGCSPAIGASAVYAFAAGNLTAMSFSGDQLWSYACGTAGKSSPAVSSTGVVYVASGPWLYAINSDGTLKWKKTLPGPSDASPTIGSDGTVYIGCSMSKFQAYTAEGVLKFTYTAGGAISSSAALVSDGTIYFGCNDGCLYALTSAGTLKWKFTTSPVGAVQSSPAVGADGTIYFGSSSGYIFAVSPTGVQKWRYGGGVVTSSPAIASDGSIYFGSQDRSLYALSKVGGLKWKYTTRGVVNSSPAVDSNGTIFFGSDDGSVYAFNSDGTKLWEYAAGAAVGSSPAIGCDSSLYVLVFDGSLCRISPDATPPTTPIVTDDGVYSTSATTLHATWTATDPESGIARYEYAIGTSPGAQDILPFTDAGVSTEASRAGLALANGGEYYFSVRATNGCGMTSAVGSSDGITVDITPPSATVTILSASLAAIHLEVTASDPESGIAQAQYALLHSSDASSAQWADCALNTDITVSGPFDPSQKLYIAARARNGAGLWSAATVTEIIMDTTPPTTPIVTDDGDYSTDPTTLHATWTSQDPDSGIASYSYCVGTSPGSADVIPWFTISASGVTLGGFNFTSGSTFYFSVKATNNIGLVSAVGSSDGITIETTPPTQPTVTDDGEWTGVSDSLHAVFAASDPESGIAEYSYCIGTSPGGSDIRAWTSTGSSPSAIAYGLSLSPGLTYYFTAKARNRAGLWSVIGTSDGIQYRRQESVWPKFHCDLANTGKSPVNACSSGHVNWKFQTQGYVESSAAFAGDGTAYIGSGDGRIYAISSNGLLRWSYPTGGAVDSCPAIGSHGEIYAGSCDHYLYCIQSNGALSWRFPTNGMIWSSPSIDGDGTIYFGCQDGYVYALKPDGSLKWKYNTGGAVWSSPALGSDGTIYFACGNGKLYALKSDGTLKWTYQTGTAADSSPTVGSGGVIYFGSGDGYFYAINPNGTLKWRFYTGNLVDSTAAIASDGTIYVGTGGAGTSGTMRAFSADGAVLWRFPVTGGVRSSPCVDGRGNIFFGTADGKVYALHADGTVVWSSASGQSVLSSPAIGPDGQVVVGADDGAVYCFKDYPLDTTPPTTPVVTPLQSFVPVGTPVSCRWTATDPESGIQGYSYAIGTAPGLSDLVNWANAGLATTMSRSDFILAAGQCCYFSVKACNYTGLTSAVGVSTAITIVSDDSNQFIGYAKKRPEGTRVVLPGKTVTAVFADCVFLEELDRSAGIRCLVASSDLRVGSIVDAIGRISLQSGEVVLSDASLTKVNVAYADNLDPVAMNCQTVAGLGLDTTGLLVRVSGRVTKSGAYYFVLSDGSGITSPRGAEGIEIRAGAGDIPPTGSHAVITGVISRDIVNGASTVILRAASEPHLSIYP